MVIVLTREFKKTTTATATATSLNKKFKGAVSRNSAKLGNYKMPVKLRETKITA